MADQEAPQTFALAATRRGDRVLFTVTHTSLNGKYVEVRVDQTDKLYFQLIELVQGLASSAQAEIS